MSIHFQILGQPGQDNAALVRIESGHAIHRLLFDCGEGCLDGIPFAEILAIDHLFFSHLHMDHVAGFDSFFRAVFNRESLPNRIWGPAGTARIMHHRFQAYLWNLHEEMPQIAWRVTDILVDRLSTARYELSEAFTASHDEGEERHEGAIFQTPDFSIEAVILDHKTPSIGYIVRESPRRNIVPERLKSLGLRPGPWLKGLKDAKPGDPPILIDGVSHEIASIQAALMTETPGDAVAYLTDFQLDDATLTTLAKRLQGCPRIICEAQYRHSDLELARRNFHLTATLSATLAREAGASELTLFHLSQRYDAAAWAEMLREAQAIFPATRFPEHWDAALTC